MIPTLYFNPGSCSLASHSALEEAGIKYLAERVDLATGENESPAYLKKNMWARVPALNIGDTIITENIAILSWISDQVPDKELMPPAGSIQRVRALEWLALLSSTVHVAFRPLFRPGRFAATSTGQADVTGVGLMSLNRTLALLEHRLSPGPFALGTTASLVDHYLFVFLLWMQRPALKGKLDARPGLDAARARLLEWPSIHRAITAEGLNSLT